MAKQRPAGVPVEALWSADDDEWVLAPRDATGKMHGLVTYWRPDGTLVNHCTFVHGQPHGPYKRYHESGEISRQGTFVDGRLHGTDVFIRSDAPTTENFPAGLAPAVWRAELDMRENRVVGGRCFDRAGEPVGEDGAPVPERPATVPAAAVYSSTGQRWLLGATNDAAQRQGRWLFYSAEGQLEQAVTYAAGVEVLNQRFASAEEAAAELALADGDVPAACAAARTSWEGALQAAEVDTIARAGALLLRTLSAVGEGARDEARQVATTLLERCDDYPLAPFTASGRSLAAALAQALALLAEHKLAVASPAALEEALTASRRAVALMPHDPSATLRVLEARVLYAMGRNDEAFQVVRALLAADPDAEGLDFIATTPAYAEWIASLRTDTMTLEGALAILGTQGEHLLRLAMPIWKADAEDAEEEDEDEDEDALCNETWPLGATLGEVLAPELRRYAGDDFAARVGAAYAGGFIQPSNAPLSAAVAAEDGTWIARMQAAFLPASVIYTEDEKLWIAAWWPTRWGSSRVYAQHQDEPIFERAAPAIAAFLVQQMLSEYAFEDLYVPGVTRARWQRAVALLDAGDDEAFPPHLEVARMQGRTRWIVELLLGLGVYEAALEQAATLTDWEREAPVVAQWPHLQAYWLMHHLVFDNREALGEVLAVAEGAHPTVAELMAVAEEVLRDAAVSAPFWDDAKVRGLRGSALDQGLTALFTEEGAARTRAALAQRDAAQAALDAARQALEALGDPVVSEGLGLWDVLERMAQDLNNAEVQMARASFDDASMDQRIAYEMRLRNGHTSFVARLYASFSELVDARWLAFFQAAVARGATFPEAHPMAVPGALFGLGLAMGDFVAFMEVVQAQPFYPAGFGRRRRLEVTLLAAHLWEQGAAAQAFVVQEARRFAAAFNDWQVDTTGNALFHLVDTGQPVAGEILHEMFAAARFSGANWRTAILFVEAVLEAPRPFFAPAMAVAVAEHLGRFDDGDRALVVRAYAACAGAAAEEVLAQRLAEEEEREERLALLAGLLQAAPAEARWHRQAQEGLARLVEGRVSSREFGVAVALLKTALAQEIAGFRDAAQALAQMGAKRSSANETLLTWLQENWERLP